MFKILGTGKNILTYVNLLQGARRCFKGVISMIQVRHFTGGLSTKALHFLDEEVNLWIKEDNIDVKMVREVFGQSPTGMSGSKEDAIFLSVWYEGGGKG